MSNILFVRHAQASLFAADYDQLSQQGFRQSALLGEYFRDQQQQFDCYFVGPRRRHRQTAEAAIEASGGPPPELVEISELDEHHVDRLVTRHASDIGKLYPHVAELQQAFAAAESDRDRRRSFARLFESIATLWVRGECPSYEIETWQEFTARVADGIDKIVSHIGRGRSALAVVSAGTVAATLHRALSCPDEVALGLGWRVWNCSLTGYAVSQDRFTLDHFNAMPHLVDRSDWTYR